MTIIETCDLGRSFGQRMAVLGLNLEVHAGEIDGFLGPNGSGKTTTIRMLTGLLHPSRGTAQVAGHDIRTDAETVRAQIGLLRESTAYYGWMTPVVGRAYYSLDPVWNAMNTLDGLPVALGEPLRLVGPTDAVRLGRRNRTCSSALR